MTRYTRNKLIKYDSTPRNKNCDTRQSLPKIASKLKIRLFVDWTYAGYAKRFFGQWYSWAIRSRLEPIKAKATMIKSHLPNLLTYFKHPISNAVAEGLNSKVQTVKANARGYRSFNALGTVFYFTVVAWIWCRELSHKSTNNLIKRLITPN